MPRLLTRRDGVPTWQVGHGVENPVIPSTPNLAPLSSHPVQERDQARTRKQTLEKKLRRKKEELSSVRAEIDQLSLSISYTKVRCGGKLPHPLHPFGGMSSHFLIAHPSPGNHVGADGQS